MAKSSKIEDYWREHNLESLFKELTQTLVRRTPSDPIIAIVEHLQKKYPKSFKTTTHSLMISPQSDLRNESLTSDRRLSTQSQVSGIVTIPSMNSAFTDLLNKNTSLSQPKPELIFKNLVFANRFGQQVVKLGKYIRSNRDILDEEVIKPIENKSTTESNTHTLAENLNNVETHEEPSVLQIIKYKQQIRTENNRRAHRQKLAELARPLREREDLIRSDLVDKPEEIIQQQFEDGVEHDSIIISEQMKSIRRSSHKPIVHSKEEEEILNDENIFQPKKQRARTRQKTSRFNRNRRLTVDLQSNVCQFCGHVLNKDDPQLSTTRSIQPQPSIQSINSTNTAVVDDWFETGSDSAGATPPPPLPAGSSTFRRNLFQSFDDHVGHRSIIDSNDKELTNKRSITPRLSETGLFSRSPSTKKLQKSNSNNDEN